MTSVNLFKNLATDSSLAFGLKILSVPIQYLAMLVMARWYGAELMGTYFLAFNLVMALAVVCRLGLDKGLLRFAPTLLADGLGGHLPRLLWPAVGLTALLSSIAGLAIYLGADWLAARLHAPALSQLMIFAALSLPPCTLAYLFGEMVRGLGGARWTVSREFLVTPLSFLLLLLLFVCPLLYTDKVESLGWAFLVSTLIGLGFILPSVRTRGLPKSSAATPPPFADLLRYSWPIFLLYLFALLSNEMGSLILGAFSTPQEVAAFNTAIKIVAIISLPLQAVNAVVPPLFAHFYHLGDLNGLERMTQTTAKWAYHLALPAALLIILLSSDLLGLMGPEFLQARFVLVVLVLADLVNVAAGSVGFLLIMTGQQWIFTFFQMAIGAATCLLMLAGASLWGLDGLGVAKAMGLVGINLACIWVAWRRLKIKSFCRGMFWPNLGGLLGAGLFLLVKPFAGPLAAGAVFSICYLAVVGKPLYRELNGALFLFKSESAS